MDQRLADRAAFGLALVALIGSGDPAIPGGTLGQR
jgi:hypothetical protein